MRGHLFDIAAQISRKQIIGFDAQNLGDDIQFQIRHAAGLVFQSCYGFPAGVPAEKLQFLGKPVLRPPFVHTEFPHLGADDI